MKIVVAVDANWAIGYRGGLLFHLPEDLKHFKEVTTGGVVVMGRSTLMTFPGGKPLPNRENIVISHYPEIESGGHVTTTMENLPKVLATYEEAGKEIFVIGGGSVYRQLLPYCKGASITHIEQAAPQVDTFFPNLDEEEHWKMVSQSETQYEGDITFTYCEYVNEAPETFI